jgi:hypothetical protein
VSWGGAKRELTPVQRAAMRAGSARGLATQRREKAEGMAFAAAWRERMRPVDINATYDWSAIDG